MLSSKEVATRTATLQAVQALHILGLVFFLHVFDYRVITLTLCELNVTLTGMII